MSPWLSCVFGVAAVLLVLAALDLLLGGKMLMSASRLFNRKFDVDQAVLKGLSELRMQGEKSVVHVDEAALQGRLRVFLALLILTPALMLLFLILVRR